MAQQVKWINYYYEHKIHVFCWSHMCYCRCRISYFLIVSLLVQEGIIYCTRVYSHASGF